MKNNYFLRISIFCILFSTFYSLIDAQNSVARQWNEVLLEAIRNDFARPTVHSRNLFHTSIALYDSWAVYDESAEPFLLGKTVRGFYCPFDEIPIPSDIETAREETMSYAAFRLLNHRFANSPNGSSTLASFSNLFTTLGYNPNFNSVNYSGGSAAALGNYIASYIIDFGLQDGANEESAYQNDYYEPINSPLVTNFPGNPNIVDPNRWQPLTLDVFIDQSGNEIPFNTPPFLGPEWGRVTPFAMTEDNLTFHQRNGDVYWVYHDPGNPPHIDTENVGGISEEYKWNYSLVSVWSSHLDPESSNDVLIDISPASIGNIQVDQYPTTIEGLRDFYLLEEGGDIGEGYDINPSTGQAYVPQLVSRADYGRVLAEFWADGPDSETPPGHWFTLLNYINDHPALEKRYRGQGDILDDLEWDVKAYFMLGGAIHDAAIAAWGAKGWYDYIRPISALRFMAEKGQSTDMSLPSYHPAGITLIDNYIELVDSMDLLAGDNFEHVGKIKTLAWRGPEFINNPDTDFAGVDWILAENWWPYQRPTFVTPPFAGYVSGHSTFSRAAAEVLTMFTGDAYFPGGMAEFTATQNEFLVFEEGPSTDVVLQWATYRDASDQCSLSRIWGGIHPPADDIPGRLMGIEIGVNAFNFAETYFFIDEDNDGYFDFEDCNDNNPNINPGATELCNGLDENCNDMIDENTTLYTYFLDADEDSFGDQNATLDTCQNFAPPGYVNNNMDCDDSNADIHPNADETCDGIDNNCSGMIDDGLTLFTYFLDADEDSFGDQNATLDTCQNFAPPGYVDNNMDCDDSNADIHPNADEICDGIDNNCSGMIDDSLTLFTYFLDADEDSFGDQNATLDTCQNFAPPGYVDNNMDCDDSNANIHPNANEICDGIDNNCSGMIDDGLTLFIYYYDGDQDSYGNAQDSIQTCSIIESDVYVPNNIDCDDNNNTIFPGATEIPNNGIDEDCLNGDLIMSSLADINFEKEIEVFPNPFMDKLTIRSQYQEELIVQVLDGNGKLISKSTLLLENGNAFINFSQKSSGIYFIIISNIDGSKRFFKKMIKM